MYHLSRSFRRQDFTRVWTDYYAMKLRVGPVIFLPGNMGISWQHLANNMQIIQSSDGCQHGSYGFGDMWGSLPFKNPLYHGTIRGECPGLAMNLPAARPGSIWTILDLGISVSVVFGDVDICRAA